MTDAPKGWVAGPLRKFAPLQRGFDLPTTKVVPGDFPVVYSNGIGRFHNKAMLNGPGVVTGRSGTIGRVHFVDRDYWPHNTALWVTDFKTCAPKFVYYLLQSVGLERFAGGSGVPTLNRNDAHAFEICVPASRQEQVRIAEALTEADDLIAALERLIAKKQAIKQGMMQQLLTGRLRLPGFGVTERVSTDVGLVPAEWKITSLDALRQSSRTIRYGIVQPGTYDPNGRLMLRGQDYSKAKGWANPAEVFRVSDAVEERYKSARLKTGDLIMTIVGYAGHVEVVPDIYDGANITQTTARIPIDSSVVDPAFCKYVLQSPIGQHQVDRFLKGAAQPGLNIGDVAKFLVCLPGRAEQEAISAALSDVDAQIRGLQLRLAKARAIKTGMMQQLLTGRARLPVEAGV